MAVRRWIALLALVAGCTSETLADELPDAQVSRVQHIQISYPGARQLDLLFVVERSPAMAAHANALASSLPEMIHVLETAQGGLQSIHIAVTAADGEGELRTTPQVHGDFLRDEVGDDGSRIRNYDGNLDTTFTALATLGFEGPARATPLLVAPLAVTRDPNFHREHATLMVVFLTQQDDASRDDPSVYVARLRALEQNPTNLIIAATTPPTAPRFHAYADAFPNRSTLIDVGDSDYTGVLQQLSQLLEILYGIPCFERPVTSDCTVENSVLGALPSCAADPTNRSCWSIATDQNECPGGSLLQGARVDYLAGPSLVDAYCVSQ